jgi:hypothetical protein
MDADAALTRAWHLALEDISDAVEDELESLLPALIAAGYVDADDYLWRFTPAGVARVDELGVE